MTDPCAYYSKPRLPRRTFCSRECAARYFDQYNPVATKTAKLRDKYLAPYPIRGEIDETPEPIAEQTPEEINV